MPKNATNSRPCSCCGRLIPLKTGKAKTCSPTCLAHIGQSVKQARRELYQRERFARWRRIHA